MNKFDIIKELSKQKNLSEKEAQKIITTVIEEITRALQLGDRVEFRGFGVFFTKTSFTKNFFSVFSVHQLTILKLG